MKPYIEWTKEELVAEKARLEQEFAEVKAKGLNLNISRGKPAAAQLDLTEGMLTVLSKNEDTFAEDGTDCRNYGVLTGIPEARKLIGDICEVPAENVIVYGNASLTIMFDTVARSFLKGVAGCTPWNKLDKVKFLCPVPGYDRHFGVTEYFGVEMINVPMTPEGPDMDMVEKLVAEDDAIKGIWCVPKYSNPQGYTYSDETVKRFANLKPAAKDFRIFWDNAYIIHHLYDDRQDHLLNIIEECEKAGNPDMVYEFVSTSKVSYPGAGIAALISSEANLKEAQEYMNFQIIGHDKLNQLRHVKFFQNLDGVMNQMKKHAEILRPKFEAILQVMDHRISIHAPPRGATARPADAECAHENFNSRPSARGDLGISIDAFWETFQFTPLREGRRVWRKQRRSRPDFNSRPSARGDDSGDAVQIYDLISIHAPPRGATGHEERIGGLRDDFNSRPSARGDTLVEKVKKLPDISIHAPPRGATHCLCFLRPQYSFQFTPLREGRPDCAGTRRLRKRISIHAPPRGATRFRGGTPQRPSYFNSRPSARGDRTGCKKRD